MVKRDGGRIARDGPPDDGRRRADCGQHDAIAIGHHQLAACRQRHLAHHFQELAHLQAGEQHRCRLACRRENRQRESEFGLAGGPTNRVPTDDEAAALQRGLEKIPVTQKHGLLRTSTMTVGAAIEVDQAQIRVG